MLALGFKTAKSPASKSKLPASINVKPKTTLRPYTPELYPRIWQNFILQICFMAGEHIAFT